MNALEELHQNLISIGPKCPQCKSIEYIAKRCRDCGFRMKPIRIDAKAILRERGLA